MSTFKAMKFQVESPEQSKQIQKALFELGYLWRMERHPLYENHGESHLYASNHGIITYTWDVSECHYLQSTYKETTLEELQEMVALKISAETRKEIEDAGKAIFEQINTLKTSAKRSAEFVDRVAKVMAEPTPSFEKGHDDSTNVTKPNNIDLIKRIETLEKQMSMIHAYNTPLNAPPFRPEPKFATGFLVQGLEMPIEHEKHVEFTHVLTNHSGWYDTPLPVSHFTSIQYLGSCTVDGDMFACKSRKGNILFQKGHLNSGTYL